MALLQQNVTAVTVMLPADASYGERVDKAKKKKLAEFASRHHIKFLSYSEDPRFSSNDFTWELVDHLNARGAMKISKILDEEAFMHNGEHSPATKSR